MSSKVRDHGSFGYLVFVFLLALAPAVVTAQVTQVCEVAPPPQEEQANCVPSCERDDGRFLVITDGQGLETLTDTTLDLQIRAPGSGFELGFFDGETSGAEGLWDLEPFGTEGQLTFELYADPDGDGFPDALLETLVGEDMADNLWCEFSLDDYPAARSATGEYVYLLRAEFEDGGDPGLRTLFKVRTDADVLIEVFQQPFSFAAAVPDPAGATRLEIIYPDCLGKTLPDCLGFLDNTTYDGRFSFYLTVRDPIDELVIWDGDLDHGDGDGANPDSNDFNTLDDFAGLPYWACRDLDANSPCTADGGTNPRLPSINFEGVALGAGFCAGGARDGESCQPGCPGGGGFCDVDLDAPGASLCVGGSRDGELCQPGCPDGSCSVTGDPPDDFFFFANGFGKIFRRDGTIIYEVWGPDGQMLARNEDPSGNREWERFRLSTAPGDLDADLVVDELPAGIYEIRVLNLDLENLNAFRFDAPAVTQPNCDDGRPTALTFTYTGDSCLEPAASDNSQGGRDGTSGDYECSGPLDGYAGPVKLVPVKKPQWFEMVPDMAVIGGDLTIRTKLKNSRLFPHTELEVQDYYTGEVLQEVTLHTSCSQPLIVGEQFGSLKLSNYFVKF